MSEQTIKVTLLDGSIVTMNTEERVIAHQLAEQMIPLTTDADSVFDDVIKALAEAQQTIARQRETWEELKSVVSTNATGGRGEDINDYDIMLNIMSNLEGEQP